MIVPILLPIGRDAELVSRILTTEQIDAVVCATMSDMLDHIHRDCGPFVIGDESLSAAAIGQLAAMIDAQPEWSHLPGIILTGRSANRLALNRFTDRREIISIQRPVKKKLLVNMVLTAVEARDRQYQVRNLLDDLVRANDELRSRTTRLQSFARELTRAEERERERISQILHDDLQQMLAAARLQTEMLIGSLHGEPEERARTIYDILSTAMQTSRSLSHELNPTAIQGQQLDQALTNLAGRMAENFGFAIKTHFQTINIEIHEETRRFVYRSVQELILNCAKHAQASQASIDLIVEENMLVIAVEDDGAGFNPDELKNGSGEISGFGLFSIQERVAALGGTFEIQRRNEKGSRFVLMVPYRDQP